ncbi:dynamin family protein [Blastococcus sp. TF02A-26]|uniref:dynamin family protein n=1 Tax=Blastococcus sp. TF02A-26 TaxID=2250577 RepID=UPI000DEAEDA6|nr:dynamin family protein [Blastococcus sp. TF02A-26]RBY88695.1 GTPase [Blastococcus sp. TF02A-26]
MTAPAEEDPVEQVRALLGEALEVYADEPAAASRLSAVRQRMDEPLRIALVGRVKAGKSTLLDALVGARLAPTDAGECTRVVTVYRYGRIPKVVLHDTAGTSRVLPARRVGGGLRLDLGGSAPEDVAQVVVEWPAPELEAATLVDSPGLASLSTDASDRTTSFLEAGDGVPGVDAVLYLTRHLQPDDVAALTSFQAAAAAAGRHTATLTVLSRADEVGGARLDALQAAAAVARRMSADPAIAAVTSAVVPVAGLLALGARTLRHGDVVALRALAAADRTAVAAMLLTTDRFLRAEAPVEVSPTVRAGLLERLGLFGVRLAVALVHAGIGDAATLADELLRRSGLPELQRLLQVHFTGRGRQLRVAAALQVVGDLLRTSPRPGTEGLAEAVERIRLAAVDVDELALLARLRAADDLLPPGLRAEAQRLLGAEGTAAASRLGLSGDGSAEELRGAAQDAVARWRQVTTDPALDRPATDAADVVLASCEALLTGLGRAPALRT